MSNLTVEKCANHQCPEHFKTIAKGKLYVFPVTDPEAWGLPRGLRQKVVWLCEGCRKHFYVRFDQDSHSATVVERHQHRKHLPRTA